MSDHTDQLAAELYHAMFFASPNTSSECKLQIIKAAIEKAYDEGYGHGAQDQRKGDRAAQAEEK